MSFSWGRLGGVVGVVSAAVAAALVSGASPGHAATDFTITLSPLIGTTNLNEIPQVSYGGKIGYHLFIENSGDSTTQHATVVVTSNLATFSDSDSPSCAVNPNDSHQMLCTPYGGTFVPGATFDVNFRFTAPTSGPAAGEQVSTSASISVAAQTVGGKKNGNNGTTIAQSDPVLTNIVENTTKADTYLHGGESAATAKLGPNHPQNFGLTLPASLLGAPFGVALSIHDTVGTPLCGTCLSSWTALTIPAASFVTTAGNPFYDGATNPFTVNPYSWSMNAQFGSGDKLTQIIHIDDNLVSQLVPSCDSIGGAPTADVPMCYDTFDVFKNTKTASATGRGIENGNITFG